MHRRLLLCLIALSFAFCGANGRAQTAAAPNEGSRLTRDPATGAYNLSWWGQAGRTYFLQQSENLAHWTYLPVIESGAGQVIRWGTSSSAARSFMRLRYSDLPAANPFAAEFDGDKVSNWDELQQGTDPLLATLDLNGLPFDWETFYKVPFHTPAHHYTPAGNGLTYLQTFQLGLDPNDFYKGQTPALVKISGDGQSADPQSLLAEPLVIQVNDINNTPLANAPLTFALTTPGGFLSQSSGAAGVTGLALTTDYQGQASVWLRLSDIPGQASSVTVGAGLGSHRATATFTGSAGPGNPPAAPSNLSATALSSSWMALNWQDHSSNETGFRIERKAATGGDYQAVKTVAANLTHLTDVSLAANTGYTYRVRALGNKGSSPSSNEATGITPGEPGGGGSVDDADADPDGDGLNSEEEIALGADPNNADSDGDGVADGKDALPLDPDLTFPYKPVSRYAVVNLGAFKPVALNNRGQAVGYDASGNPAVWSKGQIYPIPPLDPALLEYHYYDYVLTAGPGAALVGISDEGVIAANQTFYTPDSLRYVLHTSFTVRFDAATGAFSSPVPLKGLYTSTNTATGTPNDPTRVYVSGMSPNGNLIGASEYHYRFRTFHPETGPPVDDYFTTVVYCAWLAPNYVPQRIPNFPDANNQADFTFPNDDSGYTYHNDQGLYSDHASFYGPCSITNSGKVLTTMNESTNPEMTIDVSHALLGDAPAAVPIELGVNASPASFNEHLQLAVGVPYDPGASPIPSTIWFKKDGSWSMKTLPGIPPNQQNPSLSLSPTKINDLGQVLVQYDSYRSYQALWQNGKLQNLSELAGKAGGYSLYGVADLNNLGMMVGSAGYQAVDAQGNPQGNWEERGVMLMPVDVNYAQGISANRAVSHVAAWAPNNGIGKGAPIYSTPAADLVISFSGATMNAVFLGATYQLTPNVGNALLYSTSNQAVSIRLSAAPLNDVNVQEAFTATVNQSANGVQNAVYSCQETTAASSSFVSLPDGIVMTLGSNSMTLDLYGADINPTYQLTAVAGQPFQFSGSGISATLIKNAALTGSVDTLYVSITCSALQLSSTAFKVVETSAASNVFRNFDPPAPTNAGVDPVPDIAPFYLQVPKSFVGSSSPTLTITAKLHNGTTQTIGTVPLIEAPAAGFLRSAKPLLMLSEGSDIAQMSAGTGQTFQTLVWPLLAQVDWDKGGGSIRIQNDEGAVAEVPLVMNGIVLESIEDAGIGFFGFHIDTENFIRKPLSKLGYTTYSDYRALTNKTLNDYVKGKAIWYSMSHGATPSGNAYTEFVGLNFVDAKTTNKTITASKLSPLGLNYLLVLADGCCSAQTSTISQQDAQANDSLLDGPREFAEAFGPKAAYVGWSWTEPASVQVLTSEFIRYLKGGRTVQQALERFRVGSATTPGRLELKIYRNAENIIDRTLAKP